jgi:hypothetical protein
VADITGLPQHGHIPIRHPPNQIHYYTDAEIRLICEYFGVSRPVQLECPIS